MSQGAGLHVVGCRAVLKKRLFAEGETDAAEEDALAAVISTPDAPIVTPPPQRGNQSGNRGNWGNQGNCGNQLENQGGNQMGNQGNSGNQLENHSGNQGNSGNAGENPGEEGTVGKSGARGYFMFLGDTVPSFYRRPHSSFDGLLTAIPCGTYCGACPN